MKKDYLAEFLPDLEEFKEKTIQFHNGEMKVPAYKSFSGGYGSYAQRGGEKHMLRLRMAGGRITKERMKFIVDGCKKYDIQKIKITTCQSIQFHDLEMNALFDLMEGAWKAGMISRGGGGDFPRNVMATALSGVTKDEYFNVLPYAEEAANYLMRYVKTVKFPRKLKVCFSGNRQNEPHATFRDLGFVARPDGKFDVYCAGGLGNNPKLGVKVAEAVDCEQILYYVDAMVRMFVKNGEYKLRGKARTRYLQDTLGIDGIKKEFAQELEASMAEYDLKLSVEMPEITKKGSDEVVTERIVPQKQEGLYSVFYQPVGGMLAPETLVKLYEFMDSTEDIEIRLTPEEGLYVINCTAEEAKKVLALTEDSAKTEFERSVACVGAAICQVGLGDSQGMLKKCVEEVRPENFKDGVLPKLHFSGCPSSCSAHQTGEIGFRGAMKQTADGPKHAFAIFYGGCALQGEEKISEMGKAMACEDIPKFLIELGKTVSAAGLTYHEWIKDHTDDMDALIAKYTA